MVGKVGDFIDRFGFVVSFACYDNFGRFLAKLL
jgi:hypothetical protein